MYLPFYQIHQYNHDEYLKLTERWDSDDGKIHYDYIISLIREGAGEDFLQYDFQSGRFNGFLSDEWDLRGFKFWEENIKFPTADNFDAIDFSYGQFWHSTFDNALFYAHFSFAKFYNCRFINCTFSFANYFACTFEKCEFINCDFVQGCSYNNCDFKNTKFDRYFFPDSLFTDCRFSSSVDISNPSLKPIYRGGKQELDKKYLADHFISIRDAYKASGAHEKQWKYYFKARAAQTRYNSNNVFKKYLNLVFNELLIGYGERPQNCLLFALFVIFIYSILYLISGIEVNGIKVSLTLGPNIISSVKSNPTYLVEILSQYFDSLYFSVVTFTTVGYGDVTPIKGLSRLFSATEMLIGVTLTGVWVATLLRKLIR